MSEVPPEIAKAVLAAAKTITDAYVAAEKAGVNVDMLMASVLCWRAESHQDPLKFLNVISDQAGRLFVLRAEVGRPAGTQ